MKIGYCCNLSNIETIDKLGFDYLEINASEISRLSEDAFEEVKRKLKQLDTPIRCSNIFFTSDFELLSPNLDKKALHTYIEKTISRCSTLGVKLMVFGSGKARSFNPPLDYSSALERFHSLLLVMGDCAAKYKVNIALEPLNKRETNMQNTLAEAKAFLTNLNHKHVVLLADLYHMFKNNESMDELKRLAPIAHIHIANKERLIPKSMVELKDILNPIFESGYKGLISIETFADESIETIENIPIYFKEIKEAVYSHR